MNNKTKKILHSSEFYVGVIIILFGLLIQMRSGQFFTGNNLVDILRSFTIPVMFCMGELMVLISGGVDCGSMSILWTKKVERLCCFFKFLILLLLWCQITNRAMYPLTVIPAFYVFKDCSAGFL